MFGIDGGEFFILALLALFLLGPERLPGLAKQAARALHDLRKWTQRTREDIGRELGPEFENFDLADLNPKRFVQKHLLDPLEDDDEDEEPAPKSVTAGPTYGHPSLISAGSGDTGLAADGGSGPVSLHKLLPGTGAELPVPVGPEFTTDVFAAPAGAALALAERRLAVPAWGDTESARESDDFTEQHDLTEQDHALDESESWDASIASFYLPPPIDMDAT